MKPSVTNGLRETASPEERYRRIDEKETITPIEEMSQFPEQCQSEKKEAEEESLKRLRVKIESLTG